MPAVLATAARRTDFSRNGQRACCLRWLYARRARWLVRAGATDRDVHAGAAKLFAVARGNEGASSLASTMRSASPKSRASRARSSRASSRASRRSHTSSRTACQREAGKWRRPSNSGQASCRRRFLRGLTSVCLRSPEITGISISFFP